MNAKEALEKIKNEYDAYFIANKYQCNGDYGFDKSCTHYNEFVIVDGIIKNNEIAKHALLWIRDCYDCYYKDEQKEDGPFYFLEQLINDSRFNTDFYDKLPGCVCEIVEKIKEKYSKEPWFEKAWEEYRQHVLTSSMDQTNMPGYVFNKYIHLGENTCVCCGEIIPEGRQYCINCGNVTKCEPINDLLVVKPKATKIQEMMRKENKT